MYSKLRVDDVGDITEFVDEDDDEDIILYADENNDLASRPPAVDTAASLAAKLVAEDACVATPPLFDEMDIFRALAGEFADNSGSGNDDTAFNFLPLLV